MHDTVAIVVVAAVPAAWMPSIHLNSKNPPNISEEGVMANLPENQQTENRTYQQEIAATAEAFEQALDDLYCGIRAGAAELIEDESEIAAIISSSLFHTYWRVRDTWKVLKPFIDQKDTAFNEKGGYSAGPRPIRKAGSMSSPASM